MKSRPLLVAVGVLAAAISSAAGLNWAKDYKDALKEAARSHKIVMIDFTASWCVNCHKLDRTTYLDPGVVKTLGEVISVKVDYDKELPIAKLYNAKALPVIVFIDANQREIGRISQYVDGKQFVALAKPILARAKRK